MMNNGDAIGYRLRALAPLGVVAVSRGAAVVIGLVAIAVYRLGQVDETSAIWIALVLGTALLSAYPRHRLADLMAALSLWLTAIETITGYQIGHFAWRRWLFALATLGLILLMRWVQDFRAAMRASPARSIGQFDRRGARRIKTRDQNAGSRQPLRNSPRDAAIEGFCRTLRS